MESEFQKPVNDLSTLPVICDKFTTCDNDPEQKTPTKYPYPKRIFLIIGNEFCERFTYYGLSAILVLYMTHKLEMDDDSATIIYHVFQMMVYFMCTIGAIISDIWLGKFKTIFFLSIIYASGSILISASAIPNSPLPAQAILYVGLLLIAFGSGGIKTCVSSFGAAQFKLPAQAAHLAAYFSMFYFTINTGSLVSMSLTPILREDVHCFGENSCYSLAFGIPAVLMIISIVLFLLGKSLYKMSPPCGNMLIDVVSCIRTAIVTKRKEKKTNPQNHFLDYSITKHGERLVNDTKAVLRVLVLYLPLPVFYALYDQQGSRWILQATRMDGDIGLFTVKPDQTKVLNPLMLLVFITLYETAFCPLLCKIGINSPLRRLTLGGFMAAAAFVISGILELQLEKDNPIVPDANHGQLRIFNGYHCDYYVRNEYQNFTLKSIDAYQAQQIELSGAKGLHLHFERINHSGNVVCPTKFEKPIELLPNQAISFFLEGENFSTIEPYIDNPKRSRSKNPAMRFLIATSKVQHLLVRNRARHTHIILDSTTNDRSLVEGVPGTYDILIADNLVGSMTMKRGSVSTVIITEQTNNSFVHNTIEIVPANSICVLWILPQYVILTLGEVMFNVTGLLFTYSQAPECMKSVLKACWLLANAFGDVLLLVIVKIKVFDSKAYEFFFFSTIMVVDMIFFMYLAYRYKPVKPTYECAKRDL